MIDAALLLKMNECSSVHFPVAVAQLEPGVPAQSISPLPLSCFALVGHSFFLLCCGRPSS